MAPPARPTVNSQQNPTKPLSGAELVYYIEQRAKVYNVDPYAALAVATTEGGFSGAVGDKGTSFGPFQLHEGGALPKSISRERAVAWANSPTGVDYALSRIGGVTRGATGKASIVPIVTQFERPADPASEVIAASSRYPEIAVKLSQGDYGSVAGMGPKGGGGIGGFIGDVASGIVDLPGAIISGGQPGSPASKIGGAVGSLDDAVKWLFNTDNILRIGEVIAGAALVAFGILMAGKAAGSVGEGAKARSSNIAQARQAGGTVKKTAKKLR